MSKSKTTLEDGNLSYDFILQDLIIKRARVEGAISILEELIKKEKENVCVVEVKPDVMEMLNEQN